MPATRSRGERLAPEATPPNDVYTVLLAISLAALLFGCLLLFLDYNQYEGKPPAPPTLSRPAPPPAVQPPPPEKPEGPAGLGTTTPPEPAAGTGEPSPPGTPPML